MEVFMFVALLFMKCIRCGIWFLAARFYKDVIPLTFFNLGCLNRFEFEVSMGAEGLEIRLGGIGR